MQPTNWILGITGGIAAYKTPELVRLMKKQGCEVRVVLSKGAASFVTPLTLQAVSGHPVYTELMDTDFEAAMGHIELARWAQGILIAPASANRLAALAMGMADDLLTTLCLATQAPIYIAPAMNQMMWHHEATQLNIVTLKRRGVQVLGPGLGEQACGEFGLGRMVEPQAIIAQLPLRQALSNTQLLAGKRVVITAGPTQEAIDPVRYITNRSSGKMGFALAAMAQQLGAKVTLISGPVNLTTPPGVERIAVVSAQQMLSAALEHSQNADIFIGAAAVSDYRPSHTQTQKIKKHETNWTLDVELNPDILATVAASFSNVYCVGFAAETQDILQNAQKKLHAKHVNLIAVNDVSRSDIGFDSDRNALTVIGTDIHRELPIASKSDIALQLLQIISEDLHAKNKIKST